MTDQPFAVRVLSRPEFIALVAALMALNALAIDVMLPALPNMGEALGISAENERQLVVSAYMIGFGIAQIAFGPITDRFGRRAPLFVGLAIYVCAPSPPPSRRPSPFCCAALLPGAGRRRDAGDRHLGGARPLLGARVAEVMSLVYMVFMAIPIVAPGIGQLILFVGPWQHIFLFMAGLAAVILLWSVFRLPESLRPEYRRPLTFGAVFDGFRLVVTNRVALFYGLAGMFLFAAMFGFIVSSQQIFVGIYGLGPYFPIAFATMAGVMAVSSFLNSRVVRRFGMRRLSHGAMVVYLAASIALLAVSLAGPVPFWLFYLLLLVIQFVFSWASSNMNALSMEPLGAVAGTAAAVFGFSQTVGGAMLGTFIGQQFNGTLTPNAAGYVAMGVLVLGAALAAEKGRLFGIGTDYGHAPAAADRTP